MSNEIISLIIKHCCTNDLYRPASWLSTQSSIVWILWMKWVSLILIVTFFIIKPIRKRLKIKVRVLLRASHGNGLKVCKLTFNIKTINEKKNENDIVLCCVGFQCFNIDIVLNSMFKSQYNQESVPFALNRNTSTNKLLFLYKSWPKLVGFCRILANLRSNFSLKHYFSIFHALIWPSQTRRAKEGAIILT